jgi:hypothetical protein
VSQAKITTIKTNIVKAPGGISAVQGLALGAALVSAPSLIALILVLLAPGLLCLFADRAPGRRVARASLLAGFAFSVAPAWHLWTSGLGFDHAFALLGNISTLAPAWCAGAAGWLASELAPLGVHALIEAQTQRRKQTLIERRKQLIEDWNLPADHGKY